ncbi:hypothetical protein B0H13DRAFT_1989843 [Mycena leptocephala]|nr:hypothetical protein B0H13DRAFT_1989843 [Mycena leptocephala]
MIPFHQNIYNYEYDPQRRPTISFIPNLLHAIMYILSTAPHRILLQYLLSSSRLDSPPFRFRETVNVMEPLTTFPPELQGELESILHDIVTRLLRLTGFNEELGWMDKLVVLLMVHWIQTPMQSESVILPSALILYLNERRSDAAVKYLFRHMVGSGKDLWRVVTQTLAKERQDLPSPSYPERMEILMALWRSLSLGWRYRRPSTSEIHQMLQVVMDAEASARSLTLSITAQLKWRYLDVLFGEATTSNYTALFTSPMLPTETAVKNPQDGGTMEDPQERHEEGYNLPTLWGNRL